MLEAPTATSTTTPSSDDAADLEKKTKELLTVKASLDDATSRAVVLTAEIQKLQARLSELRKASDVYIARASAQQNELSDQQKLISQKWDMAVAGAKDQKDAIDKSVSSVDEEIAAQLVRVDALQKDSDKAQTDWNTAAVDLKKKQDKFADLKVVPKSVDDRLKNIKLLVDQAAKAESQGDVPAMYFLLQEASAATKALTILSPDEYGDKIKVAQADVEAAKGIEASRKTELDAKAKQLSEAQAQAAVLTGARQTTILAKLKQIRPTSEAAAAAVPAAPAPVPAKHATPPPAKQSNSPSTGTGL